MCVALVWGGLGRVCTTEMALGEQEARLRRLQEQSRSNIMKQQRSFAYLCIMAALSRSVPLCAWTPS